MKIHLHSIRAKNFLQIGNEFETFPLDKNSFTVIVGKNGSGKSTLLDMITYGLYNKSYREKVRLGQLVNSTNKKKMLVEVAFTAGTSTYVVRRGEKPKVFEIYKDKELIEADPSVGDMQKHLEENILGQSYKTFCQINVIGKSTYKQFMTLSLPERRVVVEDILDSGIYSVMASLAKNDYKNLNIVIEDRKRDMKIIESSISTTEAVMKQYETDRKGQITRIEADIAARKDNLTVITSKLNPILENITSLKYEQEKIIPLKHRAKFSEELESITSDIRTNQRLMKISRDNIISMDNIEVCSHCLQKVDENHKKDIKNQHQKEINSYQEIIDTSSKRLNKFQEINEKYKEVDARINSLDDDARVLKNSITDIENQIRFSERELSKLNEPIDISGLPDVIELRREQSKLVELQDLDVKKLSNIKKAISYLGDDGIKAKLIDKYIPVINKSVNEYLSRMNMFVEFTLDSEFNEEIKAINRENFTYHSFSEGQKMRIDLAILLTWRKIAQMRNSMTTNLFLLDEVADGSLDDEGMMEFVSILKEVADAQNTFIISHKEQTIDLFENVIRVETVGNFSNYVHE